MNNFEALKNLLLDTSIFEELEKVQNPKPNLFSILKVTNAEIRHSNFLAWLFNPRENHGLNSYFLDEFLKCFAKESLSDDESIKLLLANGNNFEVRREWKNIDILLISPKDKIVITIENKIKALESEGQLEDYLNKIKANYPDYDDYYIFLTIDGTEASENQYHSLSYSIIIDILEQIINKKTLTIETKLIIKDYIDVIRSVVEMEKPEIKELCMQIYEKHKQAIDLIIENVPNDRDQFINDLREWIQEWSKDINFKNPNNHKWFEFWTDNMDELLPKQNENVAYKYYISAAENYCEIGLQYQGNGIIDTPLYEFAKKLYTASTNKEFKEKKWNYRLLKNWKINFEGVDEVTYVNFADNIKEQIRKILFEEIPAFEETLKQVKDEF